MKNKIIDELKSIIDPELAIDIVTLGLVRDVIFGEEIVEGQYENITVIMTLTSAMCPFADVIVSDVVDTITFLDIGPANVELTFDPPWEASAELKMLMGF